MKLEEQVTSLELSKKLKSLGVRQESYFYWAKISRLYDEVVKMGWQIVDFKNNTDEEFTSAFTVAELGEILPDEIGSAYSPQLEQWWCGNTNETIRDLAPNQWAETEADARAKMLIHLIEKGIIKL